MSLNKFWSSTNKPDKSDVTKGYVDKKFINLATGLATKASKFGGLVF